MGSVTLSSRDSPRDVVQPTNLQQLYALQLRLLELRGPLLQGGCPRTRCTRTRGSRSSRRLPPLAADARCGSVSIQLLSQRRRRRFLHPLQPSWLRLYPPHPRRSKRKTRLGTTTSTSVSSSGQAQQKARVSRRGKLCFIPLYLRLWINMTDRSPPFSFSLHPLPLPTFPSLYLPRGVPPPLRNPLDSPNVPLHHPHQNRRHRKQPQSKSVPRG
jgi:hypothetical protein